MKNLVAIISLFFLYSLAGYAETNSIPSSENSIKIVKEMFTNFAEKKDMSVFDKYHADDFVLETNGVSYDRAAYKELQANAGKKEKSLTIKYDEIFAEGNRVAAKIWIDITMNDGSHKKFQVILIAKINDGKISRIDEMTDPRWEKKLDILK